MILFNPFEKIAGMRALVIGLCGIALTSVLFSFSEFRFDSFLHIGLRAGASWVEIAFTQLLLWLIPSLFFYIIGRVLSKSKIRAIDVFGCVAFAQLPFVVLALTLIPDFMKDTMTGLIENVIPDDQTLAVFSLLSLVMLAFFVWFLILLFNAVKVSCNLRGVKLWGGYFTGLIGANICAGYLLQAAALSGIFCLVPAETQAASAAQASSASPAGTYEGVLDFGAQKLRFVLIVEDEDGVLTASCKSPDQSPGELPLEKFEIRNGQVSFEHASLKLKFKGTINNAADTIRGKFTQRATVPLVLKRVAEKQAEETPAASAQEAAESPAGIYEGVLDFGVQKLRFVLIVKEKDGVFSATSRSPDQGNAEVPFDKFEIKKSQVAFENARLNFKFKGSINNSYDTIRGKFTQGVTVPLVLKRVSDK